MIFKYKTAIIVILIMITTVYFLSPSTEYDNSNDDDKIIVVNGESKGKNYSENDIDSNHKQKADEELLLKDVSIYNKKIGIVSIKCGNDSCIATAIVPERKTLEDDQYLESIQKIGIYKPSYDNSRFRPGETSIEMSDDGQIKIDQVIYK